MRRWVWSPINIPLAPYGFHWRAPTHVEVPDSRQRLEWTLPCRAGGQPPRGKWRGKRGEGEWVSLTSGHCKIAKASAVTLSTCTRTSSLLIISGPGFAAPLREYLCYVFLSDITSIFRFIVPWHDSVRQGIDMLRGSSLPREPSSQPRQQRIGPN